MGEGETGGVSDIVKVESSGEHPRAGDSLYMMKLALYLIKQPCI